MFVYDGKTGEKKSELGSPAHKGTVMAVCWGPDSKQLLSVSADKTSKLWNVESGECETYVGWIAKWLLAWCEPIVPPTLGWRVAVFCTHSKPVANASSLGVSRSFRPQGFDCLCIALRANPCAATPTPAMQTLSMLPSPRPKHGLLPSVFTFGEDVDEQQLGCAWLSSHIMTLSLSGYLNYLDPANPAKPKRIVQVCACPLVLPKRERRVWS